LKKEDEMEDIIKDTKKKIENFKKAIAYLDGCDEFGFEDFEEAHRIAGTNAQVSELREMWAEAKLVLPGPGHSSGVESLREVTRDSFVTAISEAKKLVDMMEKM
jgi:hypothetical protein